jgi:hypothetical protein
MVHFFAGPKETGNKTHLYCLTLWGARWAESRFHQFLRFHTTVTGKLTSW